MSLRARLASVLTAVMLGPLIAVSIAVWVVVPGAAEASAARGSARSAASAASALADRCRVVTATASATAARLADPGAGPGAPAGPLLAGAVALRPGLAAVLFTPAGQVVAAAGIDTARAGDEAVVQERADCAAGTVAGASEPALAASALIRSGTSVTGRLVVWDPLDDASLSALSEGLGLDARLALLGPSGSVLSATAPRGRFEAALAALRSGRASGPLDGAAFGSVPASDGSVPASDGLVPASGAQPFTVVAVTDADTAGVPSALLLTAALAAAAGALLIALLLSRLVGPLAEAEATRRALGGTFDRFGDALAHTHDLDGLLAAVVDAAVQGAGADSGAAWVTHVPSGGTVSALEERVLTPGQPTGVLDPFAVEAVMGRRAVVEDDAPLRGPVAAMPLTDQAGTPVGAIVLARRRGSAPFDDTQLERFDALASHTGTAVANLRLHEETRLQSVTDSLTGTGNHRALGTTLAREVERASRYNRPLSVLMLDLDHFKQVNDTLGHAFGDLVLREVAARLTGVLRDGDMLARRGGEEFAVVLPETDAAGACRAAERILAVVRAEPFGGDGQVRTVTMSAGVAAFPHDGGTSADLLRAADVALYVAKDAGRDQWFAAGGAGGAQTTSHAG